MYDDSETGRNSPEPAQKLLYHATGKLYRYLAGFAGEDPDEVEKAYHDSLNEITAGADPVLIGDAIGQGMGLGFSLAERRRALQRYHDELVRRELAPPAYDAERIEDEVGDISSLRVLVSEPDCQFFITTVDEPGLLVRTPGGGEVEIPLEFEPRAVEPVESGETVSEVVVRSAGWSSPEEDSGDHAGQPDQEAVDERDEDRGGTEIENLDAAREVILDEPKRAMAAAEGSDAHLFRLAGTLIERYSSVPFDQAPDFIYEAIRHVGLDVLEERCDEINDEDEDLDEPEETAQRDEDIE